MSGSIATSAGVPRPGELTVTAAGTNACTCPSAGVPKPGKLSASAVPVNTCAGASAGVPNPGKPAVRPVAARPITGVRAGTSCAVQVDLAAGTYVAIADLNPGQTTTFDVGA